MFYRTNATQKEKKMDFYTFFLYWKPLCRMSVFDASTTCLNYWVQDFVLDDILLVSTLDAKDKNVGNKNRLNKNLKTSPSRYLNLTNGYPLFKNVSTAFEVYIATKLSIH